MSLNIYRHGADSHEHLLIFREHCHGIVAYNNAHEMVYRKDNGNYEIIRNFRGRETSHITSTRPVIKNVTHVYDEDFGLTPMIDARKPTIIETRKFYELNCCAILMHQEKDEFGPIKVYKMPDDGAICTFIYKGHEEYYRHHLFQMEYPSERIAPYLQTWPNMDWQRPRNWRPAL